MRRRLDLAYLGTHFEGWQAQDGPRPVRTVQGELEAALATMHGVAMRAHGTSRTDAGVHAEGQVAHFDVPDGAPVVPPEGLRRGLNTLLPGDVRVLGASAVSDAFHARFDAVRKTYVYRLRRADALHPIHGLNEALARARLSVPAMRDAAAALVGCRDFERFSVKGSEPKSTVRTLERLDIEEEGTLLVITAVGDGFLRGMVRRLVGTLRDAGRGRIRPGDAFEKPGETAEARGLTLVSVEYPFSNDG